MVKRRRRGLRSVDSMVLAGREVEEWMVGFGVLNGVRAVVVR